MLRDPTRRGQKRKLKQARNAQQATFFFVTR
jgi:hypothetical protein